jgi:hypothetical protein
VRSQRRWTLPGFSEETTGRPLRCLPHQEDALTALIHARTASQPARGGKRAQLGPVRSNDLPTSSEGRLLQLRRKLIKNGIELRKVFSASLIASDTSIEAALEPVKLFEGIGDGRLQRRQPICCPTLWLH